MIPIVLDYETFYTKEYSLRKMTPAEYILSPLFECHGVAVEINFDGNPFWIEGPDVPHFFSQHPPDRYMSISHNQMFDQFISTNRYGWTPKLIVDTLGIARAMLGHRLKYLSLESVSNHLGFGGKVQGALGNVMGMSLEEIKSEPNLYARYIEYALHDTILCGKIYKHFLHSGLFPVKELLVMDTMIRCCINPKFILDQQVLHDYIGEVIASKNELLAKVGMYDPFAPDRGRGKLMSNDQFAELLQAEGVDPPRKISLKTGKEAWAFAKTDLDFVALEEHPNPAVQALVAARLGNKTTIEETRTQRFINISQLEWPITRQGNMPMPLNYNAAHTHRMGGAWKLNVQNLKRGGKLRRALTAPKGHVVVAPDASQVEARGTATISEQWNLVKQFEDGEDVYASFASLVFGFPIDKKNYPDERFVGKQAVLGLGYGLGADNFGRRIKIDSKIQMGRMITLPPGEADRVVQTYRGTYSAIPAAWRVLNTQGIDALAHGRYAFQFGPCVFEHQAIRLPNGLHLHYHDLHWDSSTQEWWFTYGGIPKKLYGGKLMENIIQALARIILMDAALRIRAAIEKHGLELAVTVHDELVYVILQEIKEVFKKLVHAEMVKRPDWMPDWPLACEVGEGLTYGDAK